MIHKNVNRILIMILICIMLFNFTMTPIVQANPLTLTALLGSTTLAKEFLAFILLMASLGVVFDSGNEAKSLYTIMRDGMELYQINDMLFLMEDIFLGFYDDVSSEISSWHAYFRAAYEAMRGTAFVPGEPLGANVPDGIFYTGLEYMPNYAYQITFTQEQKIYNLQGSFRVQINNIGYTIDLINLDEYEVAHYSITNITSENFTRKLILKDIVTNELSENYRTINLSSHTVVGAVSSITSQALTGRLTADAPLAEESYNPDEDRRYIPPPWIPHIFNDHPSIEKSISSDGSLDVIYDGDLDDYLNDIVDNATFEDLTKSISGEYSTSEIVQVGDGTLSISVPNDGTIPGDIPGEGDIPADLGGIATGIGAIGTLLQNISTSITNIFSIPGDLTLNFDSLRLLNFKDKFPFSIPWDIYRAIAVFAQTPQDPEISVDLDTAYLDVQHQINLSAIDTPIRFARYVMSIFFILFLATKTRDLIKW